MTISNISHFDGENIFVDTNILVRKIEGKHGYRELSSSNNFFASEFSILEFKRSVILKHYSLYTLIIDNDNNIDETCKQIRKLILKTSYQKDARDWLDILERLGYPDKNNRSIIANLRNLMRFQLLHLFKENVDFIDSIIKCDLINMKTKDHNKFISKIECKGCKNHSECINKTILHTIYDEVIILGQKEGFDKICYGLEKIFNDEALEKHDCVLLGDVVVIIDAPDDMLILTRDCEHFLPICSSLNKNVRCDK